MVDAEAVRRVGLALPRSYEAFSRHCWKLKVRQLVYVAFSRDETSMGFGFPKVERDGLIASDPETFFLPPTSDLRYQWVCARLARLDDDEMRELVTDAWRMCVPKMLQEMPDLPAPAVAAWAAIDAGELGRRAPAAPSLPALARPRRRGPWAHEGARPPARRADPETPDRGGDPRRAGLPLAELRLDAGPRR